jgi:hypothetical protein
MMREKNTGILDEQKKEPWRAMIQSTGSALVWILILLVLGGLYLSVNAKAASAGRSYLSLEERVEEARRKNSELVAQLAEVTSPQRLNDLAASMGLKPATNIDVRYIFTDDVPNKEVFEAPPPSSSFYSRNLTISPAYTETLVEAIERWLGIGGSK